ncbi:MAG: transketolase, partial [Muribaculaceae bacterium]|nr:transketolase [Muribaculaceae bacterium]
VEQEAQIRLLEQMDNLAGHQAALVLRPCDSAETVESYRLALENKKSPTVLVLSRQNLEDIPSANRAAEAAKAEMGGYVVYDAPDTKVVLVANGSEVSLAYHVAEKLGEEGIGARVVSVPSVGLFCRQPKAYRDEVIPSGVKVFGITAGLPASLFPVMKNDWEIFGMERFGASAPAKVLDEKFGYTVDNVLGKVKAFLAD